MKSSCQGARRSSSGCLSEIAASIDVLPCRARSCRSRPRKHWARRDQIDDTRRRLRVDAPPSAIACACASDSDSMSNKPVQSPPEILSYAIKVFVPLMSERARMGVLDRPRQVPIGGPPLIG